MKHINLLKAFLISSVLSFSVNTMAQPKAELVKTAVDIKNHDIFFLSDQDDPFANGQCRKIISRQADNTKDQVHFYIVNNSDEQWYKDFAFFKCTQTNEVSRYLVYDITNNAYIDSYYSNTNNKPALSITKTTPKSKFFIFQPYGESPNTKVNLKRSFSGGYLSSVLWTGAENGKEINMLDFAQPKDMSGKQLLNVISFPDADFISENTPDVWIKQDSRYFFFERTYKLHDTYNTVVFPVDVPVKNFHHLYNNGQSTLKIYRLMSVENNSLLFKRDLGDKFEANVPYIIMGEVSQTKNGEETMTERYMTEIPVDGATDMHLGSTQNDNVILDGATIQVIAAYKKNNEFTTSDAETYVMHGKSLINCANAHQGVSMKRFRWYVKRTGNYNTPITMSLEDATGIEVIKEADSRVSDKVYDLNGTECGTKDNLISLKKGLYIIDGKVRQEGR